jgi:two-component system, LytTR family, sensor kinase
MATSAPPSAPTAPILAPPAASARRRVDPGRLRWWAAGAAAWTLLALLSALQSAVFLRTIGEPVVWRTLVPGRLVDWYTCAVFTPVYFWMSRHWPLDRRRWPRHLPLWLAATGVFVVLKYAMLAPLVPLLDPRRPAPGFGRLLASNFISETIIFWVLAGVVHAVVFYRRSREHELRAARLQTQLSEAQLEALGAQLHPHFLFNALQGVSTLIHRDARAADEMLTRLGELLRLTLQRGGRHEVPLDEELVLLGHYLAVIEVRFQDRLAVTLDVPDELRAALVPHFVLQPLVENALQHGIARRGGRGRVEVAAACAGDELLLSVTDDGPGLGDGARGFPREGIGLSNTRRRLAQLYGARAALAVDAAPGGGLRVALRLPHHTTPAGERETA